MTYSTDPSVNLDSQDRLTPNLTSSDPYEVLGVSRDASARDIKRAYFALVREYPPEEQPDSFKLVRVAYERLRSADVKAETDLFLFQRPEPWEPRKRRSTFALDVGAEGVWLMLNARGDLGRTDFGDDFREPEP